MNGPIDWIQIVVERFGPPLGAGVATLLFGWLFARLLRAGMRRAFVRARLDPTLASFCANLVYVTLLTLVVITALDRFGFPAVSFAAVLGAAGLGIGLALKGTLSNFAAGVLLIALRPFNVGDRIEVAGTSGVVRRIEVFATVLEAEGGRRIVVPNASITGGNIVNHSPA